MDWEQDQNKDEEEFVPLPYPTLQFTFKQDTKYQCNILIVALYGASSLFALSTFENIKPTNRINFSKAKQQSLADLYELNNQVFLIFNDHIEPMKEIYLAKFIDKAISFKKAIVLSSLSKNTLNKTNVTQLAYISTSAFEDKLTLPRFKEGLMGPEADLLQWGQLTKKQICCFLGIFGEYQLSSEIIEGVFGSLRGKHGLTDKSDISERVRKYNMKKYSNKIYL